MKKLQAAMRDKAAKRWHEARVMYKVGSPMKGCRNCGEEEEVEDGKWQFTSGFQVFRAYKPWWTKWTWKCWECGATDLACWAPDELGLIEAELGKEPLLGNREGVRKKKYQLRREAMRQMDKPTPERVTSREAVNPEHTAKIQDLEAKLAFLVEQLKGRK